MDIPEESSAKIAMRQRIQAVMRDSSLNPQEKQRKIQQIMAGGGKSEEKPPAPPQPQPQPGQPTAPASQPADTSASSSREQIQAIMRDTSLSPQEKQARIQQIMTGGGPSESSAAASQNPEPEAAGDTEAEESPPERSPVPAISSREAIQAVMRDNSLSAQEKQKKIQFLPS